MLDQFVKYRKLGGWLMCFFVLQIISLVLVVLGLAGILMTQSTLKAMGMWDPVTQIYSFVSSVISLGLTIPLLVCIGKRNRAACLIYYISCGVSVVMAVVGYFIVPSVAVTGVASVDAATNVTNIVSNVVSYGMMVAWILYFLRSKRVKVYFLGNREFNDQYMALRQEWERAQMAAGMAPPPMGGMPPPSPAGQQPPPGPGQNE